MDSKQFKSTVRAQVNIDNKELNIHESADFG